VRALLSTTRLAGAPILPVSALTGTGIDELRRLLEKEAAVLNARWSPGQCFRLAVDRAFTVAGSGTVVTGTVFNGGVAVGDRLVVSPAGLPVRVRGIQIRGASSETARAGQRCALNLAGTGLDAVHRGDWVLAEAVHQPTRRIDARVSILATETQPLRHWTPVHLHLATSDVTARVAIRRGETVAPGASAIVQLILDKPIGALNGDRFILRDQSASRTLGGGAVIDPFAPTRRAGAARDAQLAALEAPDPAAALAALLALSPGGIDAGRFERTFNLTGEHAAELYAAAGIIIVGKDSRTGIRRASLDALRERTVETVAAFHRAAPQALGKEVEALRVELAQQLPAEAFAMLLRELADARKLEISGTVARIPGHNPTANAADEKLWQAIRPALEAAGFSAPPVKDLAAQLRLKEAIVKDFLHRKAKSGDVVRVTADRFYLRTTLATLAAVARATAQAQAGQFTAAQYRDAIGLGRGLAIEILECLDTLGITQRLGDVRRMRRDFEAVLGSAAALPVRSAAASARKPPPAKPRPAPYGRR
jgi:selenocysteine-specific elongation factor